MSTTLKTIVITGGTEGIGYEAARQCASLPGVEKLIITSRTAEKAKKRIASLAEQTGKPSSLFDYAVLDLESPDSISACIASLPSGIDALILNGSNPTASSKSLSDHGVTLVFQNTTLGNVELLEGLLAAKKLSPVGARVVYSGTELTRPVRLFTGLQPSMDCERGKIAGYFATPPSACCPVPIRSLLGIYQTNKLIGGLWLSALAKERPDVYFVTVSPGGVGTTDIYNDMPQPLPCLMKNCLCVFACLRAVHTVEVGAARYVQAISNPKFKDAFPSGAVVASPSTCCPCWLGASGPLTDQSKYNWRYGDDALQKEAAAAVRQAAAVVGKKMDRY